MYEIEIRHDGLHKYRLIRGTVAYVVEQKARAQLLNWEEMWGKKCEKEQKEKGKALAAYEKSAKKQLAEQRTSEAIQVLEELKRTLLHTLIIDDTIDWDTLLDTSHFSEPKPPEPSLLRVPDPPNINVVKYRGELGVIDKLFSGRKARKLLEMENLFASDYSQWETKKSELDQKNTQLETEYNRKLREWENRKAQFFSEQGERKEKVRERQKAYLGKDPGAVLDYCDMVLTNSKYPDTFPQHFDLDYNQGTKILIVDYALPPLEALPTLKEVKYIATQDQFKESHISDKEKNRLYDDLLYQITLRSIHELYEADVIEAIASIVFNGWVNSIDKRTGQEVNACILSVQARREEFLAINLEKIDPKACFKQLKGVGSSQLHGLSAIAPILKIDRTDARFIAPYAVVDQMEAGYNLAIMDWQDFEHLIRELFEKEFAVHGGEVKITQASRDGGVDAVAFDPDPIRGGKIVIQAKRYTNVVGLSAVRDLYGTVVNEGATKGILVTTADYGPDAYDFAKGKPITLLNGSNLLHLLEKHGHKARIDLKEAKQILREQS